MNAPETDINFPRNLNPTSSLEFIRREKNIPLQLMKLYQYYSHRPSIDSILKLHFDFEFSPFDEDRLKNNFSEFTNIFILLLIILYISRR